MNRLATLQAKFILGILPVVVIVAVLFSALFAMQNYRQMREALTTKQRVLPEVYSVALAALSRDFAPATIGRVIGSLALDPDVARATVFDDDATVLAQVKLVDLGESERHAVVEQIIYDDMKPGRQHTKGKIRVVFHERALDKSIADGVVRDVILILLLVAAIVLAAVIANRIIIGRPLERFLQAIRRADEEHVREPVAWSSRDELGRVILAYNNMLEKLVVEESALRERTDDLTRSVAELRSLGEVGQAVSSTLDLDAVLSTVVAHAVQISGADAGTIYEYNDTAAVFEPRANYGVSEEMVGALRDSKIRLGDTIVGKSAAQRSPMQIADVTQDDAYRLRAILVGAGIRAVLALPLMREDRVIGALSIRRRTAGEFAPSVVTLLQTFASQSVLAIENARLFRQIQTTSEELKAASEHKSHFLASMSHELRTPLNAILGFNELILDGIYGETPQDMKAPLEEMHKSGKHLLRLINNVLDLAKIEAGKMELALGEYAPTDVVESVRSGLYVLAGNKGVELAASVPPDLPWAYGDGGRITQCLMNLAGNSLKFTKSGKIEISATLKAGTLIYRVTDTGIGIPAEKIGTLFTEFKQTDAAIAQEYGGTGLGLAITKKFVEMHGGRIWVESEVGKGSTFIFEVPLRCETEGHI